MPRLLVAVLLAGSVMGVLAIGMVTFVADRTGSYADAGLVLSAFGFGRATWPVLQNQVLRALGFRAALVLLVLTHSAALAVVAASAGRAPLPWTACASAAAGAFLPALPAALRGSWPLLVGNDPRRLRAAYALDAALFELLYLVGVVLGAVTLAATTPWVTLVVAMTAAALGSTMFCFTPVTRTVDLGSTTGAAFLVRSASARWLLVGWLAFGMVFGSYEVLVQVVAGPRIGHLGVGLLLSATAVGAAVGSVLWGITRMRTVETWVVPASLVSSSVLAALVGTQSSASCLLVTGVLLGSFFGPFAVVTTHHLLRVVPRPAASAAASWTMTLLVVGTSAGNALSGSLLDVVGQRHAGAVASAGPFLVALLLVAVPPTISITWRPRA